MLHLLTGEEVVLAGSALRALAQAVLLGEGGEGRVAHLDSLFAELLVDPDEVSLAGAKQLHDPLLVLIE